MPDPDATAYTLQATSLSGVVVQTGPIDLPTCLRIINTHLAPNDWLPRVIPMMPINDAMRVFIRSPRPRTVMEADLFAAIHAAIHADVEFDGDDCPRAGALTAHLQAHRPVSFWVGDDQCGLGECDHPRPAAAGFCAEMEPAGQICAGCSPMYDSGSEWGPEWLTLARVAWPCSPILVVAAHYGIPPMASAVGADRG